MNRRNRSWRGALLLLTCLFGCQKIGGFRDFETESASSVGGGNSAADGTPCHASADCAGDACVFGYCRPPCSSDVDCAKGSICLSSDSASGCRLAGDLESKCSTSCENPNLACGIDGTCRSPCSPTNSCKKNGEICIQSACVSQTESNFPATWGQCTNPQGETSCGDDGKTLTTCNVTKPGKDVVEVCESAAICQTGLQAGGASCSGKLCNAGEYSCKGAVLQHCSADETRFDSATPCASAALCLKGKSLAAPACAEPACGPGATDPTSAKCSDGQLLTCSADQQTFDATACGSKQCDPGSRQCVTLQIDPTEVTRKSYAAFLATKPTASALPQGCSWKTDFAPDAACLQSSEVCDASVSSCDGAPQVCVDWCDAYAYCQAMGRHLCGKLGATDTMVAISEANDPGQSEWMNACSAGGQYTWSESANWTAPVEGQACNGSAKTAYSNGGAYPAGSLAACRSPASAYAGWFDLSGNVAEWENSCSMTVSSTNASREDTCRVRGGSFKSGVALLRCDAHPEDRARDTVATDIGIRCCN